MLQQLLVLIVHPLYLLVQPLRQREANAALYRIVVVRLCHDLRTQAYLRRRTAEGMSKIEVIRCLKRYVAREVYSIIRKPNQILQNAA